jgi:GNAT superfamily N-acetyltransferase
VLELRRERADGAPSRALFQEYMALITARLGDEFEPSEEIFASEEAFTGPGTAWLVGYEDGVAVCCGGLRPLPEGACEIKRMFVTEPARGRGHGRRLLGELEALAAAEGCARVRVLTTSVLLEARNLYQGAGYRVDLTLHDESGRTDFWLEKALPPDAGRAGPG